MLLSVIREQGKSLLQWSVCVVATLIALNSAVGQDSIDFAHDVLPVLKQECGSCHTNGASKGEFAFNTREELVESGMVEPGSRADSELFLRIASHDNDERMPPEGDPLSPKQVETIGRWIDEGLNWPEELSLTDKQFRRELTLNLYPLPNQTSSTAPIDQWVNAYFERNSVESPRPISDAMFLRRAKLDLLGLPPSANEVREFLADRDPAKHENVVDRFLADDRAYADHWLSFWNDLLRNDYAGTGFIDGGRKQVTTWLHRSLMENKPFDQFVTELIAPSPDSEGFIKGIKWRGRVNASQIEPLQFSQNVSQVFLGINMKCASCHDSFIDNWRLTDAYGLAAITSDTPLEIFRCDVSIGQFATAKFVFPSVGSIDGAAPRRERLEQLAKLMTSRKNGRFPRTIVNRLWERMAGRGLVHPVDNMANEAWSEKLLDFLAADLILNGYDLRRTLRLIATSQIYRSKAAVSTQPGPSANFVFRGIQTKRLTAEQWIDAVWQVTGAGPKQPVAKISGSGSNETSPRIRAALVNSDALMRSLGRPNREQVVTTRPAELSTLQALDLSNGEIFDHWLETGAERWLAKQEKAQWSDEQLVSELFRTLLLRTPTKEEMKLMKFGEEPDRNLAVRDLLWILLLHPEFQFIQ